MFAVSICEIKIASIARSVDSGKRENNRDMQFATHSSTAGTSSVAEASALLKCKALSLVESLPAFRRLVILV